MNPARNAPAWQDMSEMSAPSSGPAPADTWHTGPIESWRSLLDDDEPVSEDEPIGFAHNGFHVDDEQHFRPMEEFSPPPEPSPPRNRHHRANPDDSPGRGRHSY